MPPGDTASSNLTPELAPFHVSVAEVDVTLDTFRFDGGVNPPGVVDDEVSVLNEGPATHALVLLPFTALTCQVYVVSGVSFVRLYGEVALLSVMFPGETWSSNLIPDPPPSQLNVADVAVTLATSRLDGGVSPPGVVDAVSVLKEGPVTHALVLLPFTALTCQV